ncbi:MAG: S9 family peptidase, partial [Desulfobulbia bacterium]
MVRLIPRSKLFGNPAIASMQIAPDGKNLSWIAPKDGVLNVWVAPTNSPENAEVVTNDRHRGIRIYLWARNSSTILYLQDRDGNENWQLFAVDLATGEERCLTPQDNVTSRILGLSWDFPDDIVVALNDRDQSWHDIYRLNMRTGNSHLMFRNDQEFGSFTLDRKLQLKLADKSLPEGGRQIFSVKQNRTEPEFNKLLKIPHEDDLTTGVVGFDVDGEEFYMISSLDRDKAALEKRNWQTESKAVIGEHSKADISQILIHPTSFQVQAYGANHVKLEWTCIDNDIENDLDHLTSKLSGEVFVTSRTRDDQMWIVTSSSAEMPGASYLFRRDERSLKQVGSTYPDLESETLQPMTGHIITSRDDLKLVSYLTLPEISPEPGDNLRPTSPVPLVLLVHGGPWARDVYGFNSTHQWLA